MLTCSLRRTSSHAEKVHSSQPNSNDSACRSRLCSNISVSDSALNPHDSQSGTGGCQKYSCTASAFSVSATWSQSLHLRLSPLASESSPSLATRVASSPSSSPLELASSSSSSSLLALVSAERLLFVVLWVFFLLMLVSLMVPSAVPLLWYLIWKQIQGYFNWEF